VKNARLLVVDDESNIRLLLEEILSEEGYDVTTAEDAAAARAAKLRQDFDLILLDIWMPDTDGISLLKEWSDEGALGPVVMMSGHGTVDAAVEATRLGALDFIEKPVSLAKLLRTVEKAVTQQGTSGTRRTLVPPMLAPVGKSDTMKVLREQVARIANHDAHTLLTGELGTGRESLARYLASLSGRSTEPFVVVRLGIADDHSGAALLLGDEGDPGAFASSHGGVLYFSDLRDMSAATQQMLFGVLERGRYRPTGSTTDRELDVRILSCAAHGAEQNLDDFRRDLLSHLSVVVIRVPPLREYSEDVPELLRYYVDLLVDSENLPFRRFGVAAQNRLRNYPWPGNIRELKNLVSRLLILGAGEEIALDEVENQLASVASPTEPLVKQDLLSLPLRDAREHFERAYLSQQLILCGGKVGQLAKRVGMERTHLYRKLRSLGVDFRQVTADK
jgi:DNA-binding NtrC family response regulator